MSVLIRKVDFLRLQKVEEGVSDQGLAGRPPKKNVGCPPNTEDHLQMASQKQVDSGFSNQRGRPAPVLTFEAYWKADREDRGLRYTLEDLAIGDDDPWK